MVPGNARRAGDRGGGSRASERRGGLAPWAVGTRPPSPGALGDGVELGLQLCCPRVWELGIDPPTPASQKGGHRPAIHENRRCRQVFGRQAWRRMEAIGVTGKKLGVRAACIAHVPCILLAESLKSFSLRDCTPGFGLKIKIQCHHAVPCSAVNS